jgi:hypothetical protein
MTKTVAMIALIEDLIDGDGDYDERLLNLACINSSIDLTYLYKA